MRDGDSEFGRLGRARARHIAVLGAVALVVMALFLRIRPNHGTIEGQPTSGGSSSGEPRVRLSESDRNPRAPIQDTSPSSPTTETPSSVSRRTVRGRVLDLFGEPVIGVLVHRRDDPTHTLGTSGPGGGFEVDVSESPAHFVLDGMNDGWACVRGAAVNLDVAPAPSILLVVARAVDLAGTVVSSSGGAIDGARVTLPIPRGLLTSFPLPLNEGIEPDFQTDADSEGRFRLPHAPGIARSLLTAYASGYRPGFLRLDGSANPGLVVVLPEDEARAHAVEGIVLRPDGAPANDAQVQLGNRSTSTDVRGEFRLERTDAVSNEAALIASKEGFQSAVRKGFGGFAKTALDRELRSLVLFLGPEALTIEGSVLGRPSGSPLVGWVVSVVDGTEIASDRSPPLLAEQLAAGPHPTATDSAGRFRVRGLYPRPYSLRAFDPKSLRSVRGGPFEAGRQDVVLSVDPDDVHLRVAGRVVSRTGRPVSAVRVVLGLVTWRGPGGGKTWIPGPSVTTDDEGRFALENVPRADIQLDVIGDEIIPASFELDRSGDVQSLALSVALRCHFRVVPTGPVPPYAWIEAFDGTGNALEIFAFEGNVWTSSLKPGIDSSGSGVLAVSEDARTLRVFSGAFEEPVLLLETSLSLAPVEVTQVDVKLPRSGG